MMVSMDFGERAANSGCHSEDSSVFSRGLVDLVWETYKMTIQSNTYDTTIRLEMCLMPVPTTAPVPAIVSEQRVSVFSRQTR